MGWYGGVKSRKCVLYAALSERERERERAASGYIAYPGTENVNSYERKKKSTVISSFSDFFFSIIWKPLTERLMGRMRFPDIHHNEFGAY